MILSQKRMLWFFSGLFVASTLMQKPLCLADSYTLDKAKLKPKVEAVLLESTLGPDPELSYEPDPEIANIKDPAEREKRLIQDKAQTVSEEADDRMSIANGIVSITQARKLPFLKDILTYYKQQYHISLDAVSIAETVRPITGELGLKGDGGYMQLRRIYDQKISDILFGSHNVITFPKGSLNQWDNCKKLAVVHELSHALYEKQEDKKKTPLADRDDKEKIISDLTKKMRNESAADLYLQKWNATDMYQRFLAASRKHFLQDQHVLSYEEYLQEKVFPQLRKEYYNYIPYFRCPGERSAVVESARYAQIHLHMTVEQFDACFEPDTYPDLSNDENQAVKRPFLVDEFKAIWAEAQQGQAPAGTPVKKGTAKSEAREADPQQ